MPQSPEIFPIFSPNWGESRSIEFTTVQSPAAPLWMIDPRERTVAVYTSITEFAIIDDTGTLSGGNVLPGLEINLAQLFAQLFAEPDRHPPA